MKLKTILILFNAVVLVSFLAIFLMPLFILGPEAFSMLASNNWIAALLFIVTLIVVNGYFISQWKLLSLLERQDWPILIQYLEERVLKKGMLRPSMFKALLNAYLITGGYEGMKALEERLKERRPALRRKYALFFAVPYLLQGDGGSSERYFSELLADPKLENRGWIQWDHAFCLLQEKRYEAAHGELLTLLRSQQEPVLSLLCLYLLDSFARREPELREEFESRKMDLKKRFTFEKWKKVLKRSYWNIQVVLLAQITQEAREWLFREQIELKGPPPNPSP